VSRRPGVEAGRVSNIFFQNRLDPKNSAHRIVNADSVGLILTNIAMIYHQQQRYGTAEPLYRRALFILESTLGPEDRNTVITEVGLARLWLVQRLNTDTYV